MERQKVIVAVAVLVGMSFLGCSCCERSGVTEIGGQDVSNVAAERVGQGARMGFPNPSAVYCLALGYKYEVVANERGGDG